MGLFPSIGQFICSTPSAHLRCVSVVSPTAAYSLIRIPKKKNLGFPDF